MALAFEGTTIAVTATLGEQTVTYTLHVSRIAQLVQRAYAKAFNASESDYFGYSIAIDGDTTVVGAYLGDGDATSTMRASRQLVLTFVTLMQCSSPTRRVMQGFG